MVGRTYSRRREEPGAATRGELRRCWRPGYDASACPYRGIGSDRDWRRPTYRSSSQGCSAAEQPGAGTSKHYEVVGLIRTCWFLSLSSNFGLIGVAIRFEALRWTSETRPWSNVTVTKPEPEGRGRLVDRIVRFLVNYIFVNTASLVAYPSRQNLVVRNTCSFTSFTL